MYSLRRFHCDSVEAVYGAAHRHVIVESLSEPRDPMVKASP